MPLVDNHLHLLVTAGGALVVRGLGQLLAAEGEARCARRPLHLVDVVGLPVEQHVADAARPVPDAHRLVRRRARHPPAAVRPRHAQHARQVARQSAHSALFGQILHHRRLVQTAGHYLVARSGLVHRDYHVVVLGIRVDLIPCLRVQQQY